MRRIMLFFVVAVAMGGTIALPALAAPGPHEGRSDTGQPNEGEPDCWGAVSSDFAQVEDAQPGIGEHSRDPVPGIDVGTPLPDGGTTPPDNDTPRRGVANQSKIDSEPGDTPPEHGDAVGDCATQDPGAST